MCKWIPTFTLRDFWAPFLVPFQGLGSHLQTTAKCFQRFQVQKVGFNFAEFQIPFSQVLTPQIRMNVIPSTSALPIPSLFNSADTSSKLMRMPLCVFIYMSVFVYQALSVCPRAMIHPSLPCMSKGSVSHLYTTPLPCPLEE